MARLPSLRGIETFVAVADTRSLRAAAQRLNVTVSAVSHRIHALEQETGLQLFDRSGRRLRLTSTGEKYLERLRPGLETLRSATISASPRHATLRIASLPIITSPWLVPRLGRFMAAHPDARIELVTLGLRRVVSADVLIGTVGANNPRSLKLFDLDITPVCTPEYAHRQALQQPADLLGTTLTDIIGARDAWRTWFAAAGITDYDDANMLLLDSQTLSYEMAIAGLAVSLGATALLRDQLDTGELVAPFDVTSQYPHGIYASSPAGWDKPIAQAFRDWLAIEVGADS